MNCSGEEEKLALYYMGMSYVYFALQFGINCINNTFRKVIIAWGEAEVQFALPKHMHFKCQNALQTKVSYINHVENSLTPTLINITLVYMHQTITESTNTQTQGCFLH